MRLYAPGERGRNRSYVARGSIAGRQYEITTGETDKRAAKAAWDRFRRGVLDELARQRDEPDEPPVPTLADLIELYRAARRPSKADAGFLDIIAADEALAHAPADQIRQADIEAAARRLYPRATPATLNRQVVTPISAVLHWAAESDFVPYRRFRRFKEPKPPARTPAPGTMKLLLANTDGHRHALLLWLDRQGWRISETLAVTWEQVNLQEGYVDAWISKSNTWKRIWLDEAVVAALANLPGRRRGRIFPWKNRQSVYSWLKRLCGRLGVTFTPHMARHQFGTDIRDAKDLVAAGTWTSEQSTLRYVETDAERARRILRRRSR